MKLNCPNCGQIIHAENINVQEMVAVCATCHTVFPFNSPAEKSKRRKMKQPEHLILRDDVTLEMSFRTNWRLESNQEFRGTSVGSVATAFFSALFFSEFLNGEASLMLPAGFALMAIVLLYRTALIAYNSTHIEMDDEKITVSRKPLAILSNQHDISLTGVEAIKCEETPVSKQQSYDLPRYHVWAETMDGNRRPIVTDVTEEYAYFIAQRLEERLHTDYDVSHLEDVAYSSEFDVQSDISTDSRQSTM